MANHYLTTAVRSFRKNRSFFLINVAGLSVGIAASLLIFLVIHYENSYDGYHAAEERIFRVVSEKVNPTTGEIASYHRGVPGPLTDALRNDFTGFEQVAAISELGGAQIYVPGSHGFADEKRFKEEEGLFFTDPGIFDIFDYQWVAGNATSLTAPHTGVIAQSLAEKYFGSAQAAIGRTIEFWSFRNKVQIGGVFKDLPGNTDLPVKLGVSWATLREITGPDFFSAQENWRRVNDGIQCFVRLPQHATIQQSAAALPGFVKKYTAHFEAGSPLLALKFQHLRDIHFQHEYGTFHNDGLSKKELWSLGLIGAFLLVVACINFINLATAQSVLRAREIGVRKVLGSNRNQLIAQFLQETGIITLCAMILGIALTISTLPVLNGLLNKNLSTALLFHPATLFFMTVLMIMVTLLAGFYPALIVSGFKPAMIFRNNLSTRISGGITLRRGLVVFQFVIAQLLVIGTIVVVKQMHFFRSRPLGFVKDGIVLIDLPSDSSLKVKYPLLKNSMQSIAGVDHSSLCWNAPITLWPAENDLYFDNEATKRPFKISLQVGDSSYYSTFELKLAAGRYPFQNDSIQEFLVNETAAKQLGFAQPGDIIGKRISFDGHLRYAIVGVLRDYHSRSLHIPVKPVAICSSPDQYTTLAVRLAPGNRVSTLARMQEVFRSVYPTYLYDITFMDEKVDRLYRNEANTAQLFKVFAALAIFISCLGLYGLVAFMAVQKTKEIGIRKVLGASVQSIVYLFSKEFTLLILAAFFVAAPIGYYFMKQWLMDFHYHIEVGAGIFIIAIVFSVVIAWIAVGHQAVKAALTNPVKSLKSE